MTFSVRRTPGVMVLPSEPTPSETLNLSVIDKIPNFQMPVLMMSVYRHGHHEAAKVIKGALANVLVPYYPLAGRLKKPLDGELQVACTGEGGWFLEASANVSLGSVNYFDTNYKYKYDSLLPTPPPESWGVDPLVLIQVTCFTCGGFVVGITMYHSVSDGLGAAQFQNALGEFARGFLHPTIAPVWLREAIPTPGRLIRPKVDLKQAPPPSGFQLELANIEISLEEINRVKKEYFQEFSGEHCSTFDVAVANLWQHRTQAMELEKDTQVSVTFTVNARRFMDPPLPKGYYGNCVFRQTVTVGSRWLVEASSKDVVKVLRDKKVRGASEFKQWTESEEAGSGLGDPFTPTRAYTTLVVTDWGSLGFDKVDYGWGRPDQVLPVQQRPSVMPYAVLRAPPMQRKGVCWMTYCVSKAHLPTFLNSYRQEVSFARL